MNKLAVCLLSALAALFLASGAKAATTITFDEAVGLVNPGFDGRPNRFSISSDGEFASIAGKGGYDRSSLTEDEQLRYNMWMFSLFNQYDFAYHKYKAGELDQIIWGKLEYEVPRWIASLPGVREWWEQDKVRMSRDFVNYVEEKVADLPPSQSLPTMPRPKDIA